MDITAERVSVISDLRRIHLGALVDKAPGEMAAMLARVVPGAESGRIAVAAFNASV